MIFQTAPNEITSLFSPFGQKASSFTVPSSFVYVTNVGGNGGGEHFHRNTGMVAGDFYSANNGSWIQNRVTNFSHYVYGKSGISCMYFLWGEYGVVNGIEHAHQGVDFQDLSSNPAINFPLTGVVVSVGDTGRVGIYSEQNNATYFFAHMTNRTVSVGQRINANTIIGYEGAVGTSGAHLHFEVRSGNTVYMGAQDTGLHTLNPYDYMNRTIDPDKLG